MRKRKPHTDEYLADWIGIILSLCGAALGIYALVMLIHEHSSK